MFQPGVNEDLAATACWGTQQAHFHGENKHEGVFAIWYGKGPGVDRTGDAFRHGNLAGTHPLGGVLALMGDDHTCESSTTAHQSEYAMVDAMIPVLNPAGVQELLDYGIYGWALSRYAGCWVGLKCMKDTIDASATVDVSPSACRSAPRPTSRCLPGGLNIRWPDLPLEQEARLHTYKLEAAKAFGRANGLDQIVVDSPDAQARDRHLRQVLHGRAPGAAIPGHRRGRSPAPGAAYLQGRHDLAARAAGRSCASRAGWRRSSSSRRSAG